MKLKRQQQGLAMVEFAIVGLLLLTIMFGICEMGILLYNQAIITNASREATRSGIVLRKNPLTDPQIQAVASAYYLNHLVSFPSTSPTTSPTVTVTHSTDTNGELLTVNITYNYTYLVLSTLTAGVIPSTKLLTATSTMYKE